MDKNKAKNVSVYLKNAESWNDLTNNESCSFMVQKVACPPLFVYNHYRLQNDELLRSNIFMESNNCHENMDG